MKGILKGTKRIITSDDRRKFSLPSPFTLKRCSKENKINKTPSKYYENIVKTCVSFSISSIFVVINETIEWVEHTMHFEA